MLPDIMKGYPEDKRMFVDHIHMLVQSGDGGNGCESFAHRNDKKLIPDGGDGGTGGRVVLRASHQAPPLSDYRFKQHLIAESGEHGKSNRKRGRNGKDLLILLPVGTKVYDRQRKFLIRELLHENEEVIVLEGGGGGAGNSLDKHALQGKKGTLLEIEFVLRIRADIFFVGLPNSGKSSLLSVLTRVKTREQHYPFATLDPQLGVYKKSDYETLTLCELPSLYSASHEGRGRGNDFLKHLEEAKFIFYILSVYSKFASSFEEQFKVLRNQLEIYNPELLHVPYAVVINKIDLRDQGSPLPPKDFACEGENFFISAKTGEGMKQLTAFLNEKIDPLFVRNNHHERSENGSDA